MENRSIKSKARSSSLQLTDCIASLLALELLSPSQELYLMSPWAGDVTAVSNRLGQLRAVLPDAGKRDVGLAETLSLLSDRGTTVRVICRPDQEYTDLFLRRLAPSVEWRESAALHEKGLLSSRFYLRGSMNFTYSGISLNDEAVELTDDPEQVSRALLSARNDWEML